MSVVYVFQKFKFETSHMSRHAMLLWVDVVWIFVCLDVVILVCVATACMCKKHMRAFTLVFYVFIFERE